MYKVMSYSLCHKRQNQPKKAILELGPLSAIPVTSFVLHTHLSHPKRCLDFNYNNHTFCGQYFNLCAMQFSFFYFLGILIRKECILGLGSPIGF